MLSGKPCGDQFFALCFNTTGIYLPSPIPLIFKGVILSSITYEAACGLGLQKEINHNTLQSAASAVRTDSMKSKFGKLT